MAADSTAGRSRFYFVASLLFALTFGATLGTLVLATKTLPISLLGPVPFAAARRAHAFAQVFGFAALFVMGVALHVVPRIKGVILAAPGLATQCLWLQATGALLAVTGALLQLSAVQLAGALLLTAAAGSFAWVMDRTLVSGAPTPQHLEQFLRAGCIWLVVASLLAVAASTPWGEGLQAAVWEAALWGFAASWVFGMSLRLLPAHLGLTPVGGATADLAFLYYQPAVLLWVAVAAAEGWLPFPGSHLVAGLALAAAGGGFAVRLGMLGPRPSARAADRDGFQTFVVCSYFWLSIALVLSPALSAVTMLFGVPASPLLTDFGRHAFTLGFLTQMIAGVALRVIPVFSGGRLWSPRARTAVMVLLNLAVLLRGLEVPVALGIDAVWPLVALSGPVAVAAFLALALNLVLSLRRRGASGEAPSRRPAGTVAGGTPS